MPRPTPLIRSLTENSNWIKKKCTRCGHNFWVLPSKVDVVNFCAKDCRVRSPLIRLMAQIKKTKGGHWLWTGAVGSHGYGNIKDEAGKQWRAHRLSYTLFVGPIPDGLDVLHKRECVGHPNCCAPEHLYVGTVQDNTDDRVACDRQHDGRGEKCPTHKLKTEDVIWIRSVRWTVSAKEIAAKFNIDRNYVWHIWLNITWKHLPQCPPKPADNS